MTTKPHRRAIVCAARSAFPLRLRLVARSQRKRGRPFEMGAHMRRSGRGVASQNRPRDRPVLADGGFEDLRGQNVADLRHDERQMEPRRQLAQLQVAGERHRRVMEGGVSAR